MASAGFDILSDWSLAPGEQLYDRLKDEEGAKYVDEFLESENLSEKEREILEHFPSGLAVPLKINDRFYGILLAGPPPEEGVDYTLEDMEFFVLLGETACAALVRVLAGMEAERNIDRYRERNTLYEKVFHTAHKAAGARNLDDAYDDFVAHIERDFSVTSYSLVLYSHENRDYRLFSGNRISPDSVSRFRLDVSSELVGVVSNLTRLYDVPDFRKNSEIVSCYTNDDLAMMRHFWIVPLINLNWLLGFLVVHETSETWSEEEREFIVTSAEMLAPVFANCILLEDRESAFQDPFSPLEKRLVREVEKAIEFATPVSLLDLRLKNLRRLYTLNSPATVQGYLKEVGENLLASIAETDFMARLGKGRFALILPGKDREAAGICALELKKQLAKCKLPGSPLEPQWVHNSLSLPEDVDSAAKMLALLD